MGLELGASQTGFIADGDHRKSTKGRSALQSINATSTAYSVPRTKIVLAIVFAFLHHSFNWHYKGWMSAFGPEKPDRDCWGQFEFGVPLSLPVREARRPYSVKAFQRLSGLPFGGVFLTIMDHRRSAMNTSTLQSVPLGEAGFKLPATIQKQSQRDMLFISHANPEDNEFAQWLSLQLARCGYPVWCDLTKLLGGEAFWTDIESAVRTKTVKFLYVLSRTSNKKDGPLNELQVAMNVMRDARLKDFVIPLLIDDLPHRDITIQLSRLNVVNFAKGWAGGLKILLEKLETDGVQRRPNFSPNAVAQWWQGQHGSSHGTIPQRQVHLSNWFPIRKLPATVFFHQVSGWRLNEEDSSLLPGEHPAVRHDRYIVSFAGADAFEGEYEIEKTIRYRATDLISGSIENAILDRKQARNIVTFLLKDAWERTVRMHRLPEYELSNRVQCFWFQKNAIPNDTIHFVGVDGRRTTRQVVGFKTLKVTKEGLVTKRHWHYAFEAKALPHPFVGFCVRSHVLFTSDGHTLWDDKQRLHKARRSQCALWWNPKWRDLMLAAMSHLSGGCETISIPIAPNQSIEVDIRPLTFMAPVSFQDQPLPDDSTAVAVDETEDDDGDTEEVEL